MTPSYNQAQYLEEAIRSVLLSGYPNVEHIVVDGGSTDGSVDVLRRYEPWLAHWVSEPDLGQSDALRKGFDRASGEVLAWLNADDRYEPGGIEAAVAALSNLPESVLVYGDCRLIGPDGAVLETWRGAATDSERLLLDGNTIPQQTAFVRRVAFDECGGIEPALHYIMDFDLWVRLGVVGRLHYEPTTMASFRYHDTSKTMAQSPRFWDEQLQRFAPNGLFSDSFPQRVLEESRRRTLVWAAMEHLSCGDGAAALVRLAEAVGGREWPFGGPRQMAERLMEHRTLSGWSPHDSDEAYAACVSLVGQVGAPRRSQALLRSLQAYRLMSEVFRAHRDCDPRSVRRSVWRAIRLDPRWARNRGVWSIAIRAVWPRLA